MELSLRNGIIVALLSAVSATAAAQSKSGSSGIVCWKDASGKVVGCGDKVPPEYLNSGTKVLDSRGNVRKTGESAKEAEERKVREADAAKQKADEQKRLAEQKRQDAALLNTFSNEKEIDLKRDRDMAAIESSLNEQRTALKGANERLADAKRRQDAAQKIAEKNKKPVAPAVQEDLSHAETDKAKYETSIAAKEKEKEELRKKYTDYKKRYNELRGTPSAEPAAAPAPAPTTAAAPATKK